MFLCSKIDRVIMYDLDKFSKLGEIPIKLLPSESREANEIIAM